jgi:hypothetical protein
MGEYRSFSKSAEGIVNLTGFIVILWIVENGGIGWENHNILCFARDIDTISVVVVH